MRILWEIGATYKIYILVWEILQYFSRKRGFGTIFIAWLSDVIVWLWPVEEDDNWVSYEIFGGGGSSTVRIIYLYMLSRSASSKNFPENLKDESQANFDHYG